MNDSAEEKAERSRLVGEWIRKAEEDLTACRVLMKHGKGNHGVVCFHAEQCVEKLVKAMLVWRNVDFEKTHDIPTLMGLLPKEDRPPLSMQDQDDLKSYAVDTRYVLDMEFTAEQARAAEKTAQGTMDFISSKWKRIQSED